MEIGGIYSGINATFRRLCPLVSPFTPPSPLPLGEVAAPSEDGEGTPLLPTSVTYGQKTERIGIDTLR